MSPKTMFKQILEAFCQMADSKLQIMKHNLIPYKELLLQIISQSEILLYGLQFKSVKISNSTFAQSTFYSESIKIKSFNFRDFLILRYFNHHNTLTYYISEGPSVSSFPCNANTSRLHTLQFKFGLEKSFPMPRFEPTTSMVPVYCTPS